MKCCEASLSQDGRRIVIVGPVTPFRSGIANHTTALARALDGAGHSVLVLSFSRQFPQILFPGESDRDSDAEPLAQPHTKFIIDSLNPLTWARAVREMARFNAEVVILPWWTFFLAPFSWFIARSCRKRGIEVLFFCHNIVDHETAFWKRWLAVKALKQARVFAVHNTALAAALDKLIPGADVAVHPHPIYDSFPPAQGRLQRRADLELLFFGLVRPYKGLEVLIRALSRLNHRSVFVRIVGEFWTNVRDTEAEIRRLGLSDKVELNPHYVSDEEAAEYFARCDAVVLPYHTVTGSGVIPLAYHYGKPVVVTALPSLTDVVRDRATGFVFPVDDDAALALLIEGELTAERCTAMKPSIEKLKESMTWESLAAAIMMKVA